MNPTRPGSARSPWRPAWLALALVLAALAGGCGPGVGGTGTGQGEGSLPYFGASAASVCSGELSALLDCPADTSSPAAALGTGEVFFTDREGTPTVSVRLQGNTVVVTAACAQWRFRGDWGLVGDQAARFFGTARDSSDAPQPAVLRVRPQGGGLSLELLDAQGHVLLGPIVVTRAAAQPGAPGCS
jgi:hypothetical protein